MTYLDAQHVLHLYDTLVRDAGRFDERRLTLEYVVAYARGNDSAMHELRLKAKPLGLRLSDHWCDENPVLLDVARITGGRARSELSAREQMDLARLLD